MCTRVLWYCLLVNLLTVGLSFQQDGAQSSYSSRIDNLKKRMSIIHKENMIPINNRLNTIEDNVSIIRDDISNLEILFLQKLSDQMDKFSEHISKLEEDMAEVKENLTFALVKDESMDNTLDLLCKEQCTEGCTWRQNCNGCLCLNGQHVCSNKVCSNDTDITHQLTVPIPTINAAINGSILFTAAEQGNMTVVNNALASGTDVNWKNLYGATALHAAASTNQNAVVLVLMTAGADPNEQDGDGKTPLYRACCWDTVVMRTLIVHGADVNIPNIYNSTVLHSAASQNYPDIAELLLRAGANPRAQSMLGDTPADLARKYQHHSLAIMIDNYSLRGQSSGNKLMQFLADLDSLGSELMKKKWPSLYVKHWN